MSRIFAVFSDRRLRFIVAGGIASSIAWLVRFPLSGFMSFPAAVLVATALGMIVGFLLYQNFVFTDSATSSLQGIQLLQRVCRFVVVNAFGGILTLLITLLVRWIEFSVLDDNDLADGIAHAAGIAAGAVLNYLGHKIFTFRNQS